MVDRLARRSTDYSNTDQRPRRHYCCALQYRCSFGVAADEPCFGLIIASPCRAGGSRRQDRQLVPLRQAGGEVRFALLAGDSLHFLGCRSPGPLGKPGQGVDPPEGKGEKEHDKGDEQQESQCAKNHVVGEQIAGGAPQAEIIGKRDLATGAGSISVVLGADKAKMALPAAMRALRSRR